ncbi:MAG: hypothetical protein M1834_005670 [Cirrosporium novae-zelandiae]|nr:MAG: hypothetical protein M1834_005670 [Cirrosporium novae-zelandiae]
MDTIGDVRKRLEDMNLKNDEWEIEQGIPQFEDPFIQQYFNGREALIEQEHKQRSDHAFHQSLSSTAAEASAIIAQIREEELQTLWTPGQDDNVTAIYPGMMFTMAKERMERSSRLYQILQKFPKGALLHAHLDAMIDMDWLLEKNLSTPGICMCSLAALGTQEERKVGSFYFQYFEAAPIEQSSIWISPPTSPTIIPINQAAETFPDGGREGFKSWLKSRVTITVEESIRHQEGVNAIWKKFATCFPIINSLLFYEPVFREALQQIFHELIEDRIHYCDFRLAFNVFEYRKANSELPEEGYEEFIKVFDEELSKFQATDEGKSFYGARIIWTTLRSLDNRNLINSMKDCITLKQAYPHLIAGFDVVGQEDFGRPLADITPLLFWFRKRCVEEGVNLPFFFHAGECLGDGDETDNNLFDAILLGTRRIGHGFSLYKHPLLIEMVKERRILIESCPISNEVLRLTSSIMSHPLPALLARGVPACLSNDDPAILGQEKNGLTHDFWQALIGWGNLGLAGLASLAENSLRWSCFEDESNQEWLKGIKDGVFGKGLKAKRLKEWMIDFERFCEWVVEEYGSQYGTQELRGES